MTTMVRKQIYIEPQQDRKLKQVSKVTGLSEAEIVRRLLTQNLSQFVASTPSLAAWTAEEAFIDQLVAAGTSEGGRNWTREELYGR